MANTNAQASERRRYYRIEDSVQVHLTRINREELKQRLKTGPKLDGTQTILRGLGSITQEMQLALRRIDHEHPDVAQCIKALDRKVDMLARMLLADHAAFSHEPFKSVNLSASGVAMETRELWEKGSYVEAHLLLMPDFSSITTYGTVVGCVSNQDHTFDLRIDFTYITESDQDAIIRHIIRRQSEELRLRREALERGAAPL